MIYSNTVGTIALELTRLTGWIDNRSFIETMLQSSSHINSESSAMEINCRDHSGFD